MFLTKAFLIVLVIVSMMAICEAGFLEDFIGFLFGAKANKRSMSDLINTLLDDLFPKDDMDTEAMKNIFTMYNEDGNNLFSSQYSGMDYLMEEK